MPETNRSPCMMHWSRTATRPKRRSGRRTLPGTIKRRTATWWRPRHAKTKSCWLSCYGREDIETRKDHDYREGMARVSVDTTGACVVRIEHNPSTHEDIRVAPEEATG